jgi:hypothetical protein
VRKLRREHARAGPQLLEGEELPEIGNARQQRGEIERGGDRPAPYESSFEE